MDSVLPRISEGLCFRPPYGFERTINPVQDHSRLQVRASVLRRPGNQIRTLVFPRGTDATPSTSASNPTRTKLSSSQSFSSSPLGKGQSSRDIISRPNCDIYTIITNSSFSAPKNEGDYTNLTLRFNTTCFHNRLTTLLNTTCFNLTAFYDPYDLATIFMYEYLHPPSLRITHTQEHITVLTNHTPESI